MGFTLTEERQKGGEGEISGKHQKEAICVVSVWESERKPVCLYLKTDKTEKKTTHRITSKKKSFLHVHSTNGRCLYETIALCVV